MRVPKNKAHDLLCPPGYRLLIQLFDELNEPAAWEKLVRIFGAKKANAAKLVPGTMRDKGISRSCANRVRNQRGFRAYLPK